MAFDIEVFMTGLGIVRLRPDRKEPDPNRPLNPTSFEFWMPDTTAASKPTMRHKPIAAFRAADVFRPKFEASVLPAEHGFAVSHQDLSHSEVTLEVDGGDSKWNLSWCKKTGASMPGENEEQCLDWLPDLTEHLGISDPKEPKSLKGNDPFISRLILPPGRVEAGPLISKSQHRSPRTYQFGDTEPRAVAEGLIWSRKSVEAAVLTITPGIDPDANSFSFRMDNSLLISDKGDTPTLRLSVTHLPTVVVLGGESDLVHFGMLKQISEKGKSPSKVRVVGEGNPATQGGSCPPSRSGGS